MPRNLGLLLPRYYCGEVSTVKTSWTDRNPSRRFATCSSGEQGQREGCDLFQWLDPEMCNRSTEVIPGLLRRIRATEEELEASITSLRRAEEKNQKMKRRAQQLNSDVAKLRFWCRVLVFIAISAWLFYILMIFSFPNPKGSGKELMELNGRRN